MTHFIPEQLFARNIRDVLFQVCDDTGHFWACGMSHFSGVCWSVDSWSWLIIQAGTSYFTRDASKKKKKNSHRLSIFHLGISLQLHYLHRAGEGEGRKVRGRTEEERESNTSMTIDTFLLLSVSHIHRRTRTHMSFNRPAALCQTIIWSNFRQYHNLSSVL